MADNKVSANAGKNTFTTPNTGTGPEAGQGIKGFGSGRPDGSTVNGVGGPVGKSPQTPGPAIRGFSSGGLINAKI